MFVSQPPTYKGLLLLLSRIRSKYDTVATCGVDGSWIVDSRVKSARSFQSTGDSKEDPKER